MEIDRNQFISGSISTNDIIDLLGILAQQQYSAKELDIRNEAIENKVRILFEQDYVCQHISNTNGELSSSYPRQILVPVIDKWFETQMPKIQPSINIRDLCVQSRLARCRTRFVVPTVLVKGKYICRSSTLSSWGEICSRWSKDLLVDAGNQNFAQSMTHVDNNVEQPQQRTTFNELRGADVNLLKLWDIGSIVNLMVQTKNVVLGMKITASEKLDKHNRYRTFQMILLPYPGCEHFREIALQNYNSDLMFYDWCASNNDAQLEIPVHLSSRVDTDWSFWRSWNSVRLTQNYLQILFRHLEIDHHGILIHCLSGWDRTPLFISLLRISLWADGSIHQSLTIEEMLYLTLAYDWYLFGHNLHERLSYGEEILYFTFSVLPHLVGDEFVFQSPDVNRERSSVVTSGINIASLPESRSSCAINAADVKECRKTIREEKLLAIFRLFHTSYRTVIPKNSTALNNRSQAPDMTRWIKNLVLQWRH